MKVVQAYQTTIWDTDANADRSVHFVVLPARSLHQGTVPTTMDGIQTLFDLDQVIQLNSVSLMARTLAGILAQTDSETFLGTTSEESPEGVPAFPPPPPLPDLFRLAEVAVFADIVPIEASDLGGHSLADLFLKAATAGPVHLGALAAYASAGGTPFLILAVPAGIILCGAASSFVKWFDEHRDKIFHTLFGLKWRRPKKKGQ